MFRLGTPTQASLPQARPLVLYRRAALSACQSVSQYIAYMLAKCIGIPGTRGVDKGGRVVVSGGPGRMHGHALAQNGRWGYPQASEGGVPAWTRTA